MKSEFHIELIQMFSGCRHGARMLIHISKRQFWETYQTYKGLLRESRSERVAKVLIASVVAVEMFA